MYKTLYVFFSICDYSFHPGSGVLNAFFSQSFYAGQPPSSPDLEPRRPLETQSAGPTEAYQFPEGGKCIMKIVISL